MEEAIKFCTKFLHDTMLIGLEKARKWGQNDETRQSSSTTSHIKPNKEQLRQTHLYVLENTNDIQP